MSVHLTVNNPICIRREGTILADINEIKKCERLRRRRLRMMQVRQQSRETSRNLLDQAREETRRTLNELQKDKKSKLAQMHDRKIMEIQKEYQQDMEEIGLAHDAAKAQPNFDVILEMKKYDNTVAAAKRGKEAIQALKQNKKPNVSEIKQKRLRQVRQVEDTRSALISNILNQMNSPKRNLLIQPTETASTSAQVIHTHDLQKSDDTDPHVIKTYVSPKKRKPTKVISKKTPKKMAVKTNGKVNSPVHKSKPQQRVVVEIHQEDVPSSKHDEVQSKELNQLVVNVDAIQDDIEYVICNSDNQHTSNNEPKAQKCVKSEVSTQQQKSHQLQYNPDDYQQQTCGRSLCNNCCDNSSNFCSSSSEDSSYFSDAAGVAAVPTNTPVSIPQISRVKTYKSAANHDIKSEKAVLSKSDYSKALVQKLNIKNELNARDKARLIVEQEEKKISRKNKLAEIQEQRGIQALKRERTKREHELFFKNLENLTREERKLRSLDIQNKSREREFFNHRQQQKRNNTYKECDCNHSNNNDHMIIEQPINRPCCKMTDKSKADELWKKALDQDDDFCDDISLSRDEQILDRLKKVERLKKLLLKEYGSSLPNEILSASMTSLLNESKSKKAGTSHKQNEAERVESPEIRVINVSTASGPSDTKKTKLKKKDKKKKADVKKIDKSEIAIQTSQLSQVSEDKSVQVELSNGLEHRLRKSKDSDKLEYVEPIVTIITRGDISSTESFNRGSIVINVGNGTVHDMTKHKQNDLDGSKKTSPKSKARSLPSSSPVKKLSTNTITSSSAPTSRANSPVKMRESTDSIESQINKVSKHLPKRSPKKMKKKSMAQQNHHYPSSKNISMQNSSNIQSTSSKNPHIEKKQNSYTDNSEASSSYASLSALKPSSNRESNNNTSVIQLLFQSEDECRRKLAADISPVSTPETPSMRVINVPSNIPHFNRIARILQYNDQPGKKGKKTTIIKHEEQHQLFDSRNSPQQSSNGTGCIEPCCTCKNHSYRTINQNIEKIIHRSKSMSEQDSLMINKLDDMQVECLENLNTIDSMINKMRQDQEPSIMTQTTETSMRTLPSKPFKSNLMLFQEFQENIDSILNRILKTYTKLETIDQEHQLSHDISPIIETPKETVLEHNESYESRAKTKPRIIRDEKVNMDLRRFKRHPDSPVLSPTSSSKADSMVKKLSNDILEQSKKWEKRRILEDISFEDQTIHHELPSIGRINSGPVTSSPIDAAEEKTKDVINDVTNHDNFNHILENIPIIPASNGLRNRNEGRRTELSTIVELDTPDTASRSVASVRTPSAKSQRICVDNILSKHLVSDNIINIQNNNVPILSNLGEASTKQTKERAVQKELTIKMSDMLNNGLVPISSENNDENDRENNPQLVISLSKNAHGINSDQLKVDETLKSLDSFLIHCSARNIEIKSDKISSSSSSSFSGFSGISDILSTPTSNTLTSPPEKMEDLLMGLGLAWLIPLARKTREASALTSSSSSDITVAMAKRTKSPIKKSINNNIPTSILPGFSDVSSISIKEASKSTEKTVLMKGRTSTPNISNFHHASEKSSIITTSTSGRMSLSDLSDSLIVTNLSLHVKT